MEKAFMEAMNFRHACKVFDKSKKISDEDIIYILEAARKSPSSFGMEPWKFLVISNENLKKQLKSHCGYQKQITSCSHLIIVLCAIENVKPSSQVPKIKFARRGLGKIKNAMYLTLYASHLKETLKSDENIYAWTSKQSYLAVANMMNAAAVKGIDSCPIEGFNKEKVEKPLDLILKNFK